MFRYFVNFDLNEEVIIKDEKIIHHLNNVLRKKSGTKIALVNQDIKVYEIITITDEMINCKFLYEEEKIHNLKIDICMPLLKKNNFELCIQKTTEIGINQIIPTLYNRNVVTYDEKKFTKKKDRYNEIIKSASQQSRRTTIPEITELTNLCDVDLMQYSLVIVAYELEEENKLINLKKEIESSDSILIIVGPEGGISEEEIKYFKNENTKIVSLGKEILRAETAVITLCSNVFLLSGR